MQTKSEGLELIPGSPDWVRNFGEPMKEYGARRCDWGDCDKPAVTLRNDVLGYGWLPVCEDCRMYSGRVWNVDPASAPPGPGCARPTPPEED